MRCDEARHLLNAFHDGEAPREDREGLEAHLTTCLSCREALERMGILSRAVRAYAPTYRAPGSVFQLPKKSSAWPGFVSGLAAGVALMLILAAVVAHRSSNSLAETLLLNHVSALASRLVDVPSSDRHTVKPWFLGKLSYAPTVPNLAPEGFPLIGGRLDSVDSRRVAALVYRRQKHVITVTVCPAPIPTPPARLRGFSFREWRIGDLDYIAISDVEPGTLDQFRDAFINASR